MQIIPQRAIITPNTPSTSSMELPITIEKLSPKPYFSMKASAQASSQAINVWV